MQKSKEFHDGAPCPRCVAADPEREWVPGYVPNEVTEARYDEQGHFWGWCDNCGAGDGPDNVRSAQTPLDHSRWSAEDLAWLEANLNTTDWDGDDQ